MIDAEPFDFFSEGVRLAGDLYRPAGARAGDARPGVVLCHGYNGIKDLYLPDAARRLAERGYVAVAFDYKGWGKSDGPTRRLDPYGRVADVQAALTILGERPEVDARRMALFGWSFGCATAVWVAAFDERVRAVVGVVGVGDGARWLSGVRSPQAWTELRERSCADRLRRARTGQSEYVARPLILQLDPASLAKSQAARRTSGVASDEIPLEFVDETLAFRPEWVVDRVAPRPLLLIACSEDLVSPPTEMKSLHAAAREPKRLVILEGFDHYDVYTGPAFERAMAETLAWYAEHLGPSA
jgi:pimeloyl-ACP methyl ester carboxylesterase